VQGGAKYLVSQKDSPFGFSVNPLGKSSLPGICRPLPLDGDAQFVPVLPQNVLKVEVQVLRSLVPTRLSLVGLFHFRNVDVNRPDNAPLRPSDFAE